MAIQSTKPQTLAYGLTDSPVGLAAWILEKFQVWSDLEPGGLAETFGWDRLLDNVMAYWLTNTAGSAARLYAESNRQGHAADQPWSGSGRRADRLRQPPLRAPANSARLGRQALPHRALGRADRGAATSPRSSVRSSSWRICARFRRCVA